MRVLLVEDSARLRQTVSTWLRRNGLAVDASGDGEVDLSDPVHILTFLFLGGPPHRVPGCTPIPGCPDAPGCRR